MKSVRYNSKQFIKVIDAATNLQKLNSIYVVMNVQLYYSSRKLMLGGFFFSSSSLSFFSTRREGIKSHSAYARPPFRWRKGESTRAARRELRNVTASKFDSRIAAREQRSCTCVYRLQRAADSWIGRKRVPSPGDLGHARSPIPRASIPVRARAPPPLRRTDGPAHQGGNNVRGPRGPREPWDRIFCLHGANDKFFFHEVTPS